MVPEAGYPLELVPPVPLPRRPGRRPAAHPRPAPRRAEGRPRGPRPGPARRRGRLRRLRLGAGLPRRPAARAARSWCTRATRCPASPTSSAPGSPATSRPASPTPTCRTRRYIGLPIRRMISTLDRAALRDEAPAHLRPRRRPADPAASPAAPRAPAGSTSRSPPPPRPSPTAGVQVLHVVGPRGRGRTRTTTRAAGRRTSWCRSSAGWTSRTPPPTPCCAGPGATPSPRSPASGCPAIYVPLPIGNGEQAHNARPVVDAGGGLLVADAALTPEWVRATRARPAHRPRAARGDVGGGRRT